MRVSEELQIEQAILGGLIINGINISKDELTENDFQSPVHYELYNLIFELYKEEAQAIEKISQPHERFLFFANFLQTKGILEKYKPHLPLLAANAVPSPVIPALVEQLKRKSKVKQLKELASAIAKSQIPIEQATSELEKLLQEYKQTAKKGLKRLHLQTFLYEEPPKIDYVIGGLPVSSIGILASPGGLGKSMFVLQLLTAVATGRDTYRRSYRHTWQNRKMHVYMS